MIRRPIEHKNTGPFRKILIDILGDQFNNGAIFERETVIRIIKELESKEKDKKAKEELMKIVTIQEDDFTRFINFFKICLNIINTPLPPESYSGKKLLVKPKRRVIRYENFSYNLILISEKFEIVFPKKPLQDEAPNIEDRFIYDQVRNTFYYDINISRVDGEIIHSFKKIDLDNKFPGSLISLDEPYIICSNCDTIEDNMLRNNFYNLEANDDNFGEVKIGKTSVIDNGWEVSQRGGAQNYFYTSLIEKFLKEIRHDEIKKTYWCSYCGSLIFARMFGKINKDSFELGITTFIGEEIPKKVVIDFPQYFTLFIGGKITDVGKFIIYNNGVSYFNLRREGSTKASILRGDTVIGQISFNIPIKRMEISLYKENLTIGEDIDSTININKNTTFFIEFNSSVVLYEQLNSIEEYETFYSKFVFDDEKEKDYIGCIMRNDSLAPPVKWVPKRVTFGELRNYTFERVGIDLMLFHTFEDSE